ncbi:hypothetical protein GYMLUDRAFT_253231 [Collybiopsis luxurians FD-317 M1]|uniref:Reverse transcriptase Ty1/copia-type domain-containing protein n=1 Tax=Collybiopsis luxurians FD-317 M1 TaxID=944289 RepID=A0A0D0C5Z9_9AGAR|nr:hypothetical protein GYMLUDRAFT_253231 [Collybiopsis luxurians FD-317 M1]
MKAEAPPPKTYAPPVPSLSQVQDKIPQYFNPPSAKNTENELVTPPIPQREGIDDVDNDPGQVPPVVPEEAPADEHPIALRKPPAPEPAPAPAPILAVPPANPNPNPNPEQSDSDSSSDDTESNDGEYGHVVNCLVELQSFKEALNSPEADQWEQAMTEEITAHLTNGTWEIVDLPPGQVAIGSKWIYKLKHKVDGTVEHFVGFSDYTSFCGEMMNRKRIGWRDVWD